MQRALRELVIVGLPTSQAFHLRVLDDPEFRRGELDIAYLERAGARLLAEPLSERLVSPVAIVAALLADERRIGPSPGAPFGGARLPVSAWGDAGKREGLRG
jgi:acetyl-CoA carboxylase biotin carboxylase subunit